MDLYKLHTNPEKLYLYKEAGQTHIIDYSIFAREVSGLKRDGTCDFETILRAMDHARKNKALIPIMKRDLFDAVVSAEPGNWYEESVVIEFFVDMVLKDRWPEIELRIAQEGDNEWKNYVRTLENLGISPPPNPLSDDEDDE